MNKIIVEWLAERIHKAYCEEYKKQKGVEYWTKGDYSKLDEGEKEYERVTARVVVNNLASIGRKAANIKGKKG
jgi:3'-phosphoadenosine 5'-phosphosulfate (PAPS) 3'-phosphatase